MRVCTTSANDAPADWSATSILRRMYRVCAAASSPCTWPCSSLEVVPDTHTELPSRTAREYPASRSQGVPLLTLWRISSAVGRGPRRCAPVVRRTNGVDFRPGERLRDADAQSKG